MVLYDPEVNRHSSPVSWYDGLFPSSLNTAEHIRDNILTSSIIVDLVNRHMRLIYVMLICIITPMMNYCNYT